MGHELARQTAQARARQLALTDVSDARMLSVLRELRSDRGFERVFGVVGGVDRPDMMEEVLATHRPELVFHAASRDQMELMEENAVETIRTNTLALCDFARACGKAGVQRFVLVGSHDAASMRGVLDASKLLAEHLLGLIQEEFPFTDYLTVRVGNLYRSPNSVVRVFEEQIDRGSSVTVVRGAQRRFMRADLAAQTVLQVSHYGTKGKRYALTGGETMSIAELAELIIRLRGYRSGEDVEVETIAPRYGDRPAVTPYGKHESRFPTDLPKVLEVVAPEPDPEFLLHLVARVQAAVNAYDARSVRQLVLDAMPQIMRTATPALH
jgi:FlaA1/EpsC-like NDP-sugar epimerase